MFPWMVSRCVFSMNSRPKSLMKEVNAIVPPITEVSYPTAPVSITSVLYTEGSYWRGRTWKPPWQSGGFASSAPQADHWCPTHEYSSPFDLKGKKGYSRSLMMMNKQVSERSKRANVCTSFIHWRRGTRL